jgi:hypothetical protein
MIDKNLPRFKEMNYSGKGTNYLAVDKLTGEGKTFYHSSRKRQNGKMGTHETNELFLPRRERLQSGFNFS